MIVPFYLSYLCCAGKGDLVILPEIYLVRRRVASSVVYWVMGISGDVRRSSQRFLARSFFPKELFSLACYWWKGGLVSKCELCLDSQ